MVLLFAGLFFLVVHASIYPQKIGRVGLRISESFHPLPGILIRGQIRFSSEAFLSDFRKRPNLMCNFKGTVSCLAALTLLSHCKLALTARNTYPTLCFVKLLEQLKNLKNGPSLI